MAEGGASLLDVAVCADTSSASPATSNLPKTTLTFDFSFVPTYSERSLSASSQRPAKKSLQGAFGAGTSAAPESARRAASTASSRSMVDTTLSCTAVGESSVDASAMASASCARLVPASLPVADAARAETTAESSARSWLTRATCSTALQTRMLTDAWHRNLAWAAVSSHTSRSMPTC